MNSQSLRKNDRYLPNAEVPKGIIEALTQLSIKYRGLQNVPLSELKKLGETHNFSITRFTSPRFVNIKPLL